MGEVSRGGAECAEERESFFRQDLQNGRRRLPARSPDLDARDLRRWDLWAMERGEVSRGGTEDAEVGRVGNRRIKIKIKIMIMTLITARSAWCQVIFND